MDARPPQRPARALLLALSLLILPGTVFGLTATLSSSISSPGAVGQLVTWNASTEEESSGYLRYRFSIRRSDSDSYSILRDFGPESWLDWTPAEREGTYFVNVTVQDLRTGEIAAASESFHVLPRIPGLRPQVNATSNPYVFLFSAPPCRAGSRMHVEFQPASGASAAAGRRQSTPSKECDGVNTMNFYLAGMRPESSYTARAIVDRESVLLTGGAIPFVTGEAPNLRETMSVVRDPLPTAQQQLILTSNGFATGLDGVAVWQSNAPVTIITRPEPGGYFWGMFEDPQYPIEYQAIRKFDLTGMVVLETNAERVNDQLRQLGRRAISSFHHEVRSLPDGRIMALAAVEEIVNDVQGPGEVNVLGDMIIVFDQNLNVVWTWDTFDYLDVSRAAILGEVCTVGDGGCPPFYRTAAANDWTHSNSLQLTPDGALLLSVRHLDWLIKIDYANGQGDGHIIWRLGRGGDFTFISDSPWPWFSHQHDGNFDSSDPTELIVFDNGNTRFRETGQAFSRGQAIHLDEANHTATLRLNADLGVLAAAVGSAQRLTNGNYHFDAGFVVQPDGSLAAFSLEVDRSGHLVYGLRTVGFVYRSFRMEDLYTVP